jgi:hypothetical protein
MISTGYPLCRRFVPMKHNVINYKVGLVVAVDSEIGSASSAVVRGLIASASRLPPLRISRNAP